MITFRRMATTVVGQVDGKPFNLPKTDKVVATLRALQDDDASEKEVFAFVDEVRSGEVAGSNEYLIYKPTTQEYFLYYEGKKSKQAIPSNLVKFIEESYDKDIDFMPVIKCWALLLNNPRYTKTMGEYFDEYLSSNFTDHVEVDRLVEEEGMDREAAINMCTYPDIALTQHGLLATYKVVNKVDEMFVMEWSEEKGEFIKVKKPITKKVAPEVDPVTGKVTKEGGYAPHEYKEDMVFTPAIHTSGDRFYSGNVLGYQYKIGQMQHLPEKAARNLNNTFGGGGLYVGGLTYIDNYRDHADAVLTAFVNPGDILSFQDEGQAIRVDALFPNNVWGSEVELKNKYHSSEYADMSNERLETLIAKAATEEIDLLEAQQYYLGDKELPTEKKDNMWS